MYMQIIFSAVLDVHQQQPQKYIVDSFLSGLKVKVFLCLISGSILCDKTTEEETNQKLSDSMRVLRALQEMKKNGEMT